MAPSRTNLAVVLVFCALAFASVMAFDTAPEDSQETPVDSMMNYRRAVMILRRALANAQSRDSDAPMKPVKKRTCYFNAGLSHGCDYKELLRALDETNYWNSDLTPGRRRKRSPSRRQNKPAPGLIAPLAP